MRRALLFFASSLLSVTGLVHCVGDPPAALPDNDFDSGSSFDSGASSSGSSGGGNVQDALVGDTSTLDALTESGASIKLAFVTSGTFAGDMSVVGAGSVGNGVAAADLRCTAAANNSPSYAGHTFHALLATTGNNAFARIGNGPWMNGPNNIGDINQLKTADPKIALDMTETGTMLDTSATTWTGAKLDGNADTTTCLDWTTNAGTASGTAATVGGTDHTWLSAGEEFCGNPRRLYCFEQ